MFNHTYFVFQILSSYLGDLILFPNIFLEYSIFGKLNTVNFGITCKATKVTNVFTILIED